MSNYLGPSEPEAEGQSSVADPVQQANGKARFIALSFGCLGLICVA